MTSAEIAGNRFLYVTNFRSARVEVYDANFHQSNLARTLFTRRRFPKALPLLTFKT